MIQYCKNNRRRHSAHFLPYYFVRARHVRQNLPISDFGFSILDWSIIGLPYHLGPVRSKVSFGKIRNPNIEIRIKLDSIPNGYDLGFSDFWSFEFVSSFEIRI
jgi:hypothetical protein